MLLKVSILNYLLFPFNQRELLIKVYTSKNKNEENKRNLEFELAVFLMKYEDFKVEFFASCCITVASKSNTWLAAFLYSVFGSISLLI